MLEDKNIIIHTGLAKTASTFLQIKVFPYINNIYFIYQGHKLFFEEPLKFLQWINNPYHYNVPFKGTIHDKKGFQKICEKIYDFIKLNVNQKTLFISHEGFVGCGEYSHINHKSNTEILKKLFPNAKIFLVIRKQDEWIESYYNEFIITNYITLNKAIGFKNNKFNPKNKMLNIYKLNWFELYKSYEKYFGKDNVLILPYEMFREKPDEFLTKFYSFAKLESYYPETIIKLNERKIRNLEKSFLHTNYNKFISSLNPDIELFIRKNDRGLQKILLWFFGKKINSNEQKLTYDQAKIILDIQKRNNQLLANEIKINLEKYGYY